jgi:hypothetical protein
MRPCTTAILCSAEFRPRLPCRSGRTRGLTVRLSARGYRSLSRLVARDGGALVRIEARIDGHRVRPTGPDILVEPAPTAD